jgi:hypothetical protein
VPVTRTAVESADALSAAAGAPGPGRGAARRTSNGGPGRRASRKRSSARPLILVLAGLLVIAAAVLIAKSLGGSSGSTGTASLSTTGTTHSGTTHHSKAHAKAPAKASAPTTNPAETVVDVLNGTSTTGLAHRVAGDLQRSGYSQATALAGKPSGSNQTTVVEYAGGHQGDAQGVAHSISASQVQPLEGSVAALAPAATVVVIVGLDRASAGGGEEPSGGGATAVP